VVEELEKRTVAERRIGNMLDEQQPLAWVGLDEVLDQPGKRRADVPDLVRDTPVPRRVAAKDTDQDDAKRVDVGDLRPALILDLWRYVGGVVVLGDPDLPRIQVVRPEVDQPHLVARREDDVA